MASEPGIAAARKLWYTLRRLWWKAYWHLEVGGARNLPASGPYLICANHTSHLDAPAILAALPRHVALDVATAAARDVFAEHPMRNFFARILTNCLPIERSANFARGLRNLEAVLREGRPMILFPEGRRSPNGRLLPFNLGAAMLAIRTGAHIVPAHIGGLYQVLRRKHHFPAPGCARIRFGDPIDPEPYRSAVTSGHDRREVYRSLTEALARQVAQLAGR